MEENTVDTAVTVETTATETTESAEKPVRRRASRRVSAAAGAAAEVAPAGDAAPAEAAPAASATDEAPAEPKKRVSRARKKVEPEAQTEAPAEQAAPAAAPAAAADAAPAADEAPAEPKKRVSRARKKVEPEAEATAEKTEAAAPAAKAAAKTDAPAAEAEAAAADEKPKRTRRRATKAEAATEAPAAETDAAAEKPAVEKAAKNGRAKQAAQPAEAAPAAAEATEQSAAPEAEDKPAEETTGRNRQRRNRNRDNAEQNANESNENTDDSKQRQNKNSKNDNSKNEKNDNSRSSRTRQRDRKRRGNDDIELEIAEDDVLLPIAGILDILDNYAFVRTSGYLPGVSDVYVSLGQVKKYSLRRGDAVVGAIRQPRDGDNGGRQKYNAIVKIDSVNGHPVDEEAKRADITEMTPVFPTQRIALEVGADRLLSRTIDAIAPIGLGQRAIITVPKKQSGVQVISELAADIAVAAPEAHLMVVLADAQPEAATALQRSIRGEVVAATFDRGAEDQATVAELAIDRARRLVELGHDVVVLVDSLNRLARGYAQAQPANHRPALDVIDEQTLSQLKKLLSAARNLENAGSLTLIATLQAKAETALDATLLRELTPLANSVITLAKDAPYGVAIANAKKSHTQNLGSMLSAEEIRVRDAIRATLADEDADDVIARLRKAKTNSALTA
ncbi:hypothetical protein ICM05_00815 [Leucobacter sp. cx-42]|uniref:hypothetical protein n=1 Tax=unclassified Leucobacter TaxID=2621730 RepID=UPI00165E453F|nr:hypothetical protein [Leucobacter sp. cx-42]